jgi:hypothetical protein
MRAVLVIAMVVSLWPAGAIAAVVIGGGSSQSRSSSSDSGNVRNLNQEAAEAKSSFKPADEIERGGPGRHPLRIVQEEKEFYAVKKLRPILDDTRKLNEEFVTIEFEEGAAQPSYAERASGVEDRIVVWIGKFSDAAPRKVVRLGRAIKAQLEAMQALANDPAESTLDAYNASIEKYNHAVTEVR